MEKLRAKRIGSGVPPVVAYPTELARERLLKRL